MRRARWWGSFLVAWVVGGTWALSTPLLAGPDEAQHAIRAAAEVRGTMGEVRWIGFGPVALARAPEAYAVADEMVCASVTGAATPACAPDFDGGHRLVPVTTYEFRPSPAYYWVVGLLTLPAPDAAGVYAMRLVSAAICAAFLASALASASLARNAMVARIGVLVAATPMALYLGGQVNPNGVEIAAAISLWSTTQVLARGPASPDRRLVVRAGIALVVLVLMRGLSLPIGIAAVVAAVAVAVPARRRALARRTDVRVAGFVAAVAAIAAAAWTLSVYGDGRVPRDGRGVGDALPRTGDFLREAVGVFGSLDVPAPTATFALWGLAAVGVVALARPGHERSVAVVLAGLVALAFTLPIAVDAFDVPSIGFDWQGRYSLALYAGVVVVATTNAPAGLSSRWWVPAIAGTVVVGHVVAFVGAADRLAGGDGGGPLGYLSSPEWEPTVSFPPVLLLASIVVGVASWAAAAATPAPS